MRRAIGVVMCFGVLVVGCDEGFEVGSFDGSLFPDEDGGSADAGSDGSAAVGGSDAGGLGGSDAGGGGGSGAGGDSGTPSQGPAAEELAGLFAEAICDALLDCLGATLLADQLAGRDCVVQHQSRLEDGDLRDLAASIDAGFVEYHPEDVETCLDDLRALGCDVKGARLPTSCEAAVTGTVALDAECAINEDCEGDAFCDRGAAATCPGTCTEPRGSGMTCNLNDDAQCVDGLVCFGGTCEALGSGGDACGSGLPGCMPGTECFDTGSGEECTVLADLYTELDGDACDIASGPLCQPPLVCESTSGTSGTCASIVGESQSCRRSVPNQCPVSQYCDATDPGATGTCLDRPVDGEPCLNRRQQCADEHVCIDTTCRLIGVLGDGCEAASQCYSGACDASGQCAPLAECAPP